MGIVVWLFHALISLSLLASGAAYHSGDPSGLQYVNCFFGLLLALMAGLTMMLASQMRPLRDGGLFVWLVAGAVTLALLPGFALDLNMNPDPIGRVYAPLLVLAQVVVVGWQVTRERRPCKPD